MLMINGFTQIAPCMPRRYWREWPYLNQCTARGRWIEQQTQQRWERNYPENAAYAKQTFIEPEIGIIEGCRFISDSVLAPAPTAAQPTAENGDGSYVVILHPEWVGPISKED